MTGNISVFLHLHTCVHFLLISFALQTVIATGVSYAFNFKDKYQVDIVGKLQKGYERLYVPIVKPIVVSCPLL